LDKKVGWFRHTNKEYLFRFTYIFVRKKDSVAILLKNELQIVPGVRLIMDKLRVCMVSVATPTVVGMVLVLMVVIDEEEDAHVTEQR